MAREGTTSVYYALLIRVKKAGKLNIKDIIYCDQDMPPVRYTWLPIHKHPHFSKETTHSRGKPWEFEEYKRKNSNWYVPKLKNCESLSDNLIEFYVHPTYDRKKIIDMAKNLLRIAG